MFKIEERSETYMWLAYEFRTMDQVKALIQVGSGATGYKDQYSDIDLVLVVDKHEDVQVTIEQVTRLILEKYPKTQYKIYKHHDQVQVGCYFLDHFLELDLGVWTRQMLHTTKPDYRVVFSELDLTDQLVYSPKTIDVSKIRKDHMSKLWQFVNDACIGIKRQQHIKAMKAIQVIKDMLQELICLRHGIEYDYDKQIDNLESRFTELYFGEFDKNKLGQHLKRVLDLYFEYMPEYDHEKAILTAYMEDIL